MRLFKLALTGVATLLFGLTIAGNAQAAPQDTASFSAENPIAGELYAYRDYPRSRHHYGHSPAPRRHYGYRTAPQRHYGHRTPPRRY